MTNLIDRLQNRIEKKSLLTHPFYQAWQAGQLTIDDLKFYAGQYYQFEANFPRLLSAIHSHCPDREVRQDLLSNLWDEEHGEHNHRAMWLDFCSELGLEPEQVELSEVDTKTQALLDTYTDVCNDSNFQAGLAAIYAYEVQVPQVAVEKIRGLKEFYGFDQQDTIEFFQVHSTLDEEHAHEEAEAIRSMTGEADEFVVEAGLQRALDAWWVFLDGVEDRRRVLQSTRN